MKEIVFPELCEGCSLGCLYPDELTFWGKTCVYPVAKGIEEKVLLCDRCYEKCSEYREQVKRLKKVALRPNFMDRYYREKEAKAILNCDRSGLRRLVNEGSLTVRLHPHNNFILYYKSEVDELVALEMFK